MSEINDLEIVDASNTARFPENQAPSTVNNGARALEGIVARWHKDTNGSLVSTGSAGTYALAANQTIGAYYDGLTLTLETNHASPAGGSTLNVDAVGAQALVWHDGAALVLNDVPVGAKITVRYDLDNTQFLIVAGLQRRTLLEAEIATTSGTSVALSTTIPAWAKEIVVQFKGVGTDGTQELLLQIGPTGGLETTGYVSTASIITTTVVTGSFTNAFLATGQNAAGRLYHGRIVLSLEDSANNDWVSAGVLSNNVTAVATHTSAGSKALAGVLTQISLTTDGGSDAFNAGAVSLLIK